MVYSEVSDIVLRYETKAVDKAVSYFNAGKCSNEMLRDMIAGIAAMRTLVNTLEGQIQLGIQAQQKQAQADERYS